ncbi:hypothetical protein [Flavobacterium laiguense]|uniref:Uncharacterized protein n=1 Tax=Flavobacterium laiguense TaxID=2169409 RepID=A0A2U1JYZ3_9FLAO|nr:hypothetical protein [Flavobacterium laiguense]PWA10441.1 hypothetical protein DB891_04195 [Flavobacterium laiguense]
MNNVNPKNEVLELEAISTSDLANLVFDQIQIGAAPVASALNMPNLIPVNESSIGDFPWFWQSGTNFVESTYNWLNNIFASQKDYVGTNGSALTTSYFNVLQSTAYVLGSQDAGKLNAANLANAATVNTTILDWIATFGQFPSTVVNTQTAQLNYIMTQVIGWGNPGLTLSQFRNSTNPMALLPNIPIGGDTVVNDLMTYLGNSSSVANIQNAVVSFNNQLNQTRNNVNPATKPTSVLPGFMQTISNLGVTQIVPKIDIMESTAVIQNNLLPASGTGKSFSVSLETSNYSSTEVQVSASGKASIGSSNFFLGFHASAGVSYNMYDFASNLTTCSVTMTFNGVTTVTPKPSSYDISTGCGWWNPDPIQDAANPITDQSGYKFSPTPSYNFGVNGNFGTLARIMISQQPIISLTYSNADYAAFQSIFKESSSWGVSFLGIPLGGGSQSYYKCVTTQDSQKQTVTITMSPVGTTTPVSATAQLAYVVGAQILWPGATTAQNRAAL